MKLPIGMIALIGLLFPTLISAYNILFMGPFPAPSHWLWLEHFLRELLNRGHHVTAVCNHPTKYPHPNLTEIIIDPKFDIPKYFPKDIIFEMRYNSDFKNLQMWWQVGQITSEHALNDPKVKKLIESKDMNFDLLILEQFFHECFLMFAHKFKMPIVTIGTMGYADNMDHAMGLVTPWSHIPHLVLPYTDNMSFSERVYNTYLSLYDCILRRWYYMPAMQEIAERHFKEHIDGPFPSVQELEKNISLMLINSHRSTDFPRPSMPGLIDVAGVHIKPVKPLPDDLKTFLDKSINGVVYFSLGSYMKSTDMPADKVKILLNAFSKLKQNVLWKYEDENLKNLPTNVMIKKWMPQNEILAHRNVQLFLSHGGIFGMQEAIYWGVPMLCIPLYGDQHRNTIKAVRDGYALSLVFAQITVEGIVESINEMTTNPKFMKSAKLISEKFRDNPIHPLDEASYWIEYVIRHQGAPYLKSYAARMPLYRYLLLDIIGAFLAILLVTFWMIWIILSKFTSTKDVNNNLKEIKKRKGD